VSAYNTTSASLRCPRCASLAAVKVQFKFGNTWQHEYSLGDRLQWGGNDIGVQGKHHVVVDGIVEESCPNCGYDDEWKVYVHIENDRIARVENATGEFDFAKTGSHYVVVD